MSNDKTKWIFDDAGANAANVGRSSAADMTETLDSTGMNNATYVGNNEPTVHVPNTEDADNEKTQIYTRGAAKNIAETEGVDNDDPVTGWLIVVRGPGTGYSVPLGTGMNHVGRGSDARVSLPFGDTLISSQDHVRIIYDDAERVFLVAHGSSKNITRVNGQLLTNTLPLEDNSVLELSKLTRVVFKQFCGTDFDWTDLEQGAKAD